jgi:hypothetical protein
MLVKAVRGVGQRLKCRVLTTLAQAIKFSLTVKSAEKRNQLSGYRPINEFSLVGVKLCYKCSMKGQYAQYRPQEFNAETRKQINKNVTL